MSHESITSEERKIRFINEHFVYEVEELLYSSLMFLSIQARQKELTEKQVYQVFMNAVLDHSLLHGRSLLDFFYHQGDKKSARASAFVPHWKTPHMTENIINLQRRVNDEIMHLGWKRLDVRDKSWKPIDVTNELLDVTDQFLSELDQKFYENSLKTLKDKTLKQRVKIPQNNEPIEYFDLFDGAVKSITQDPTRFDNPKKDQKAGEPTQT